MKSITPLAHPVAFGRPVLDAADALAASASILRAAWLSGAPRPALKGKNIGLLCDDPGRPEVLLLQRTATELGAHVALVRSRSDAADDLQQLPHTARVLGRLYDAVICVGMPAELVGLLKDFAGVPVVDDLPVGMQAATPGSTNDAAMASDEPPFLVQAMLLGILA